MGTPTKTKRNRAIYEAYQLGRSAESIGQEWGISKQRVHQLAEREAVRLGVPLRDWKAKLPPREHKEVPPALMDMVRRGLMTVRAAAKACGMHENTASSRLREDGIDPLAIRNETTHIRWQGIYEKFMAGQTMRELALEHGTTIEGIGQVVIRYRRLTGAPAKCQYLKPHHRSNNGNHQSSP